MLFHEYTEYRLAIAEHEERLRKAANARLAAQMIATRPSPREPRHHDSGMHARVVVEQVWRFLVGRASAASAALK
jgi:hypothetical protein